MKKSAMREQSRGFRLLKGDRRDSRNLPFPSLLRLQPRALVLGLSRQKVPAPHPSRGYLSGCPASQRLGGQRLLLTHWTDRQSRAGVWPRLHTCCVSGEHNPCPFRAPGSPSRPPNALPAKTLRVSLHPAWILARPMTPLVSPSSDTAPSCCLFLRPGSPRSGPSPDDLISSPEAPVVNQALG